MSDTVLEVKNLLKYFEVPGGVLHAVDNVSFSVERGSTIGIVGESGCGKSTLGRTIVHLEESTAGQIFFNGQDVTRLKRNALKKYHEKVQYIFQDPYSSLNPRLTIEETLTEPLKLTHRYTRAQLDEEVEKIMLQTGIEERLIRSYPHELDGGRRQRVGIARALSLNPEFIVCDEPVSALDVSIQAQIINLLMRIQKESKLTLMFISHDLSVVRHISTNIGVMYLGQMVEMAPKAELFKNMLHPYTKALISAVPSADINHPSQRIILAGELTSPIDPGIGCRFYSRCPYACEMCKEPQVLEEILPNHLIACCRTRELNSL